MIRGRHNVGRYALAGLGLVVLIELGVGGWQSHLLAQPGTVSLPPKKNPAAVSPGASVAVPSAKSGFAPSTRQPPAAAAAKPEGPTDAGGSGSQRADLQTVAHRIPGTLSPELSEAMGDPDFVRTLTALAEVRLNRDYGALFAALHLEPDQEARLRDLLVTKQLAKSDAGQAARALGVSAHNEINRAIGNDVEDADALIHTLLGDESYKEYIDYERTMTLRHTLYALQESLSYTDSPLSDTAVEPLVQRMYEAHGRRALGHQGGMSIMATVGLAPVSTMRRIPPDAMAAARAVLTPPQFEALVQLQQQRQETVGSNSLGQP